MQKWKRNNLNNKSNAKLNVGLFIIAPNKIKVCQFDNGAYTQLENIWCIHSVEYYLKETDDNKMDEFKMCYTKWKKLDSNSTYCMIPFIRHVCKCKTMETENRSMIATSWGSGEDTVILGGNWTLFFYYRGVIWQYTFTENYGVIHWNGYI